MSSSRKVEASNSITKSNNHGLVEALDALPEDITAQLSEAAVNSTLPALIQNLLGAVREIGDGLRIGEFSSSKLGCHNVFGDEQLEVDLKTDDIIFSRLKTSGLVHVAASEEQPFEHNCNGCGFSVAFDPLDGSSIVDANFAVGTIIGVWPGAGLLNRCGREQVCAMVAQYGPRVTVALGFNGNVMADGRPLSCELTMLPRKWSVTIPRIHINSKAKTFAPGNLRATNGNEHYSSLVNHWISNNYTLRYSGGLVPDVYHILVKGEGVLSNACSKTAKAKLRLLFEAAPIALIVEAAGGLTCMSASELAEAVEPVSLLDVPIANLDKRVGVCFGSAQEVERFKAYLFK